MSLDSKIPEDSETPFYRLPEEIAPSENLTAKMVELGADIASPFDATTQYEVIFDQLARALHRTTPRHVLVIGELGVGQNALVSELASRADSGRIQFLQRHQFIWVDGRFIDPQESRARLMAMLSHAAQSPDLVFCVEGLAAMLQVAGAENKPALLSVLARLPYRFLGLLAPREFEEIFAGDPATAEFFSIVKVDEPELPVAAALLRHFSAGLAQHYRLDVEEEAVEQALTLSANYILNERLPSKAVRILHTACQDLNYERSELGSTRKEVTADDVVRIVSGLSGVPEETLRGVAGRTDYADSLGEVIFGQDHAVEEVATELGLIKAGLTDPGKPASVILFIGQTGTGKTEMAKTLARFYSSSKRLKTFTLGNFGEPHSVSGIIGVPAGYVGHDAGGRLINELNADPYGVFLLDEADKAHPDVMQPFLNLFDEGWVVDQRGVKAYADKSIFILTTNVGQRQIGEMCREGKTNEEIASRIQETLAQIRHTKSNRPVFTPEFLARIKRVIVFRSLDEAALINIARKVVAEMRTGWRERRRKEMIVSPALVDWIGAESHRKNERSQGKEGGRIVKKLVSQWIEAPLQREISRCPQEYQQAKTVFVEAEPREADPPKSGSQDSADAIAEGKTTSVTTSWEVQIRFTES